MNEQILLVEDDSGLVMALTDLLSVEGYRIENAATGPNGFDRAAAESFDLIILDVMLPGKSGFDVCRDLRQRGVDTPILMLTARGQVIDKVLGLKLGADDYLTKPFEPLELLARLEAMLRRSRPMASAPINSSGTFSFDSIVVDFRSTTVTVDGRTVELSAREFHLLRYFIENEGATVSREQLLHEVWGYDGLMLTRTVDVHIGLLRHKLEREGKNPRHFVTVRGHGYKFIA